MGRRLVVVAFALAACGCASPWPPPRSREAAPLYRLAPEGTARVTRQLPAKPTAPPAKPAEGRCIGLAVEIRVEDGEGRGVVAPTVLTVPGRPAAIELFDQLAYIRDFDVERQEDAFVADPVIGVLQEGAVVELTALRAGDGGPTTLAWELRTARLQRPIEAFPARDLHGNTMTIQLPTLHRADAAGVRPVEDGVWSLLARLPDAEGKPFSVLARVKPIRRAEEAVESGWFELNEPVRWSSSDPPPDEGDSLPARAARGEIEDAAAGLLEVRGVVLSTELAAGSVVEAAAAAVALDRAVPLDPADLGVSTGLVRGARATCLLQETYVRDYDIESVGIMGQDSTADPEVGEQVSGLVAEVDEGGALRLSWTSTPEWNRFQFSPAPNLGMLAVDVPTSAVREARVVPGEGTRLVVLARLEDGRSAGVLVRFGKY